MTEENELRKILSDRVNVSENSPVLGVFELTPTCPQSAETTKFVDYLKHLACEGAGVPYELIYGGK